MKFDHTTRTVVSIDNDKIYSVLNLNPRLYQNRKYVYVHESVENFRGEYIALLAG